MSEANQPKPTAPPADLWSRLMGRDGFPVLLVLMVPVVFFGVTIPLRNHVLVLWVYGQAGVQQGIHVLPGKHVKFSDGDEAPYWPEILTTFGAFALAVVGTFTVAFLLVKFYEILRKQLRQE